MKCVPLKRFIKTVFVEFDSFRVACTTRETKLNLESHSNMPPARQTTAKGPPGILTERKKKLVTMYSDGFTYYSNDTLTGQNPPKSGARRTT